MHDLLSGSLSSPGDEENILSNDSISKNYPPTSLQVRCAKMLLFPDTTSLALNLNETPAGFVLWVEEMQLEE